VDRLRVGVRRSQYVLVSPYDTSSIRDATWQDLVHRISLPETAPDLRVCEIPVRSIGQTCRMAPDERVVWHRDTRPAAWIAPCLHGFCVDTGSVVPEGFDAYCRIFHPLRDINRPDVPSRTWAEVATQNERIVHSEMQIHMISHPAGSVPEVYDLNDYLNEMAWGELPLPERSILVDVLRSFTGTPDHCWFCVWMGFGGIDFSGAGARVRLPHREYALYPGPVELALATLETGPPEFASDPSVQPWNTQSPNIWWPEDRAWIVATEIDYAWTYVGGSEELIASLLTTTGLEALPAKLSDRPFEDSDTINAALDGQ
jgi:hypothetical protein